MKSRLPPLGDSAVRAHAAAADPERARPHRPAQPPPNPAAVAQRTQLQAAFGEPMQRRVLINGQETRGGRIINPTERQEDAPELNIALGSRSDVGPILTALYRMHNGGNPPEHSFTSWEAAVRAAEKQLERSAPDGGGAHENEADSDSESSADTGESSKLKGYAHFMSTVLTYHADIAAGIHEKFRKRAETSRTGANDSHQSLAQAGVHAAWLEAYQHVWQQLSNTLSRAAKKKVKEKMAHHGMKAKQTGEEHHK